MAISERTQALADALRDGLPVEALRTDELLGRVAGTREELAGRWHRLEDELPDDLESVVHRGRLALWELVRILATLLVTLPRHLVRGIGAVGSAAEGLADRGARAGEAVRDLAGTVPPSRRARRRAALRLAGWTSAGFGLGFVVGWLAARRQAPSVTYEPPHLIQHAGGPTDRGGQDAPGAAEEASGGPVQAPRGSEEAPAGDADGGTPVGGPGDTRA